MLHFQLALYFCLFKMFFCVLSNQLNKYVNTVSIPNKKVNSFLIRKIICSPHSAEIFFTIEAALPVIEHHTTKGGHFFQLIESDRQSDDSFVNKTGNNTTLQSSDTNNVEVRNLFPLSSCRILLNNLVNSSTNPLMYSGRIDWEKCSRESESTFTDIEGNIITIWTADVIPPDPYDLFKLTCSCRYNRHIRNPDINTQNETSYCKSNILSDTPINGDLTSVLSFPSKFILTPNPIPESSLQIEDRFNVSSISALRKENELTDIFLNRLFTTSVLDIDVGQNTLTLINNSLTNFFDKNKPELNGVRNTEISADNQPPDNNIVHDVMNKLNISYNQVAQTVLKSTRITFQTEVKGLMNQFSFPSYCYLSFPSYLVLPNSHMNPVLHNRKLFLTERLKKYQRHRLKHVYLHEHTHSTNKTIIYILKGGCPTSSSWNFRIDKIESVPTDTYTMVNRIIMSFSLNGLYFINNDYLLKSHSLKLNPQLTCEMDMYNTLNISTTFQQKCDYKNHRNKIKPSHEFRLQTSYDPVFINYGQHNITQFHDWDKYTFINHLLTDTDHTIAQQLIDLFVSSKVEKLSSRRSLFLNVNKQSIDRQNHEYITHALDKAIHNLLDSAHSTTLYKETTSNEIDHPFNDDTINHQSQLSYCRPQLIGIPRHFYIQRGKYTIPIIKCTLVSQSTMLDIELFIQKIIPKMYITEDEEETKMIYEINKLLTEEYKQQQMSQPLTSSVHTADVYHLRRRQMMTVTNINQQKNSGKTQQHIQQLRNYNDDITDDLQNNIFKTLTYEFNNHDNFMTNILLSIQRQLQTFEWIHMMVNNDVFNQLNQRQLVSGSFLHNKTHSVKSNSTLFQFRDYFIIPNIPKNPYDALHNHTSVEHPHSLVPIPEEIQTKLNDAKELEYIHLIDEPFNTNDDISRNVINRGIGGIGPYVPVSDASLYQVINQVSYGPYLVKWGRNKPERSTEVQYANDKGFFEGGISGVNKEANVAVGWKNFVTSTAYNEIRQEFGLGLARGNFGVNVDRSQTYKATAVEILARGFESGTLINFIDKDFGQRFKIRHFEISLRHDFDDYFYAADPGFGTELLVQYKGINTAIANDVREKRLGVSIGIRGYNIAILHDFDQYLTEAQANWGRGWQLALESDYPDLYSSSTFVGAGIGKLNRLFAQIGGGIGDDGIPQISARIQTRNIGVDIDFLNEFGQRILQYALNVGRFTYIWQASVDLSMVRTPNLFGITAPDIEKVLLSFLPKQGDSS